MAKIRPIHGQMSGSIGGNTWSNNKGGQYVRQRTKPTNPNSTKQQAARAIMATLTHNWGSLTDAQRGAWKAWAGLNPSIDTLGNTILLSGQQAYISLNARLVAVGATINVGPPATPAPSAPTTITISSNTATAIVVAQTPTPIGGPNRIYGWMTAPASAGRDPNRKQARLIGYSALNVATGFSMTTPYGLTTGLTANFYFGVMDLTGQVSPPLKVRYVLS